MDTGDNIIIDVAWFDTLPASAQQRIITLTNLLTRARELIDTRLQGHTNEDNYSWPEWRGLAEDWLTEYAQREDNN